MKRFWFGFNFILSYSITDQKLSKLKKYIFRPNTKFLFSILKLSNFQIFLVKNKINHFYFFDKFVWIKLKQKNICSVNPLNKWSEEKSSKYIQGWTNVCATHHHPTLSNVRQGSDMFSWFSCLHVKLLFVYWTFVSCFYF